jgi:hypothetical protein
MPRDRGLTQEEWYTVYGANTGPKRFDTIAEAMAFLDRNTGLGRDQFLYVTHVEVVHRVEENQ